MPRATLAATIFGCTLLGACGRDTPGPPPSATPALASTAPRVATSASTSAPSASPPADAAGAATSPAGDWVAAVRLEQWDDAWRGLEALPPAQKDTPETRYVRARVALARGDDAAALPLLTGIEAALPLLVDDVARFRAEAKLKVGPFADAGEYFAVQKGAGAQLKAAQAFEKANDHGRARIACDKVVRHDGRKRAEEAEARAIRFRLAEAPGPVEIADARWLAVYAPDLAVAQPAATALPRLDPKQPLTGFELMKRGGALADAGRIDEALRSIDDAASAPGTPVSHIDRLRAKGYVLYKSRSRYLEAAKVLHDCEVHGGPHAAEDAFHSARALSRADKDDDAIKGYEQVSRRYAKTKWGDEAKYFVPYLHILHGEWREAAKGFDEYLRNYPDGVEKKDAARNRAIAYLMLKDHKTARRLFEQLAGEEGDAVASARFLVLAGVAALGDGDRTHAVARWTDVARMRPLSWPAMMARARLLQAGAPVPPTIEPPEGGSAPEPLVIKLPHPVDVLHRIGLEGDAERELEERERSVAEGAGGRTAEAKCAAYGQLGRARRRYQVAHQIPTALLMTAPGAKNQWAWECAYPHPYEDYVRGVEQAEKLPEGLVYAVMRQESAYDPSALSPAHAVGLLQLLPDTAKHVAAELGREHDDAKLTSPPYNIALGARFLKNLLTRFRDQTPLAVAAYNCGPEAVARWASRSPGMDLDVFVERIPYRETREYVAKVMGNLARYAYLQKGEAGVPKVPLELPVPLPPKP